MVAKQEIATLKMSLLKPSARNREAVEKVKLCGCVWEFTANLPRDRDSPEMMIGIRTTGPCNSTIWEYKVTSHFEIPNHKWPAKTFDRKFELNFNSDTKSFEIPLSRQLKEYLDPKNGYVVKQNVTMSVDLKVVRLSGVPPCDTINFWEPRGCLADAVLIVQGKRLNVCKRTLAAYSDVFKDLFFGGASSKKTKKEDIVIDDVNLKEFNNFLNLAHNGGFIVTPTNVEHLLKIAMRFECSDLLRRCGEKIAMDSDIRLVDKFKYAEMYQLTELQEQCFAIFKKKSPTEAKELITSLSVDYLGARTFQRLALLATHIGT